MSRTPRRPQELVGHIFSAAEVISSGILTKGELRSKAWRPLFRGVYADARATLSHEARCEAAAKWLLPPQAVIAGRSAVAIHGGPAPGDGDPIDVLIPPGHRFGPVHGIRVHASEIAGGEVIELPRLTVTSPLRSCWDLAQWYDLVEAVVQVDALLGLGAVKADALSEQADLRVEARGGRRFAAVAGLADGGAASPPESRTRVGLVLAGLPRPVTQHIIDAAGRFVARVDLAWPRYRVAVEYDGVWHAQSDQFHRDRRRLNELVGQDWIVLHLTARRLHTDFAGFVAEVTHALTTRGWHR
ncbi:endonuclease domain-containing protein [Catellatospora tritici]|uniref:endonuclease domain-containing protein n=1 Tax=Catellatospora tritici TaxID=2851566 RepID=UPI001C2D5659|nr:endonuclease domain-containing protein [Catellatospora tritici]MBV1849747.1 endonuclease domain-containing protein [Catellatospora tritici]